MMLQTKIILGLFCLCVAMPGAVNASEAGSADDLTKLFPSTAKPCDAAGKKPDSPAAPKPTTPASQAGPALLGTEAMGQGEAVIFDKVQAEAPKQPSPLTPLPMAHCQ